MAYIIDVETGEWKDTSSHISGGIDSYYEYLWKCWVLFEDRDSFSPGVKFKDADLLGVPVRVTVGNALAKEGVVEIKERRAPRREQRLTMFRRTGTTMAS